MDLFVIGDIHGCYYTFKNLLDQHWDRENEVLIQVGDLIDRGKHAPQTVNLARQLKEDYPNQVAFLKGNHEYEIILHVKEQPNHNWFKQCGKETIRQYELAGRDIDDDVRWFMDLPLFWQNNDVLITHAGISQTTNDPYHEDDDSSVLWNRGAIQNIGKLQIFGHTPCKTPTFDHESNSWNIDTGAAFNGFLTGMKLSYTGQIKTVLKEPTAIKDIR